MKWKRPCHAKKKTQTKKRKKKKTNSESQKYTWKWYKKLFKYCWIEFSKTYCIIFSFSFSLSLSCSLNLSKTFVTVIYFVLFVFFFCSEIQTNFSSSSQKLFYTQRLFKFQIFFFHVDFSLLLQNALTIANDPGTSDDSGRASERLTTSSVAPRDADSSRDRLSDVSIRFSDWLLFRISQCWKWQEEEEREKENRKHENQ